MEAQNVIVLLGGVLVIFSSIITFFVSNSLKKLDQIGRMEEKLAYAVATLGEVSLEVKKLFGKSINYDQEIKHIDKRLTTIEDKMGEIDKHIQSIKME